MLRCSISSLYSLLLEESRSVELGSTHDVLPKKHRGPDRNYYYFPSELLDTLGTFVQSEGRRTRGAIVTNYSS